jgi:tetratricopeptide (TPR) repeat protein
MSQVAHEDPLESEIRRHRERLAACPTTHPEHGNASHDLATSLFRSWTITHDSALLEEATTLHREALALRPGGHPDRAQSCNNLANALLDLSRVKNTTTLLEEAIIFHREALALRPGEHPERARSCNNLANALLDRYRMTGISALLDDAISLYREALALRPAGHPNRAMSCKNLANALLDSYQMTGISALLDDTITLYREALALRPAGHPDHAVSCGSLATALHSRYSMTGTTALLDESIELHREELALQPGKHPHRARSCSNLATGLLDRYKVTGSSALLDDAITLYRESLALNPVEDPYRAFSCNNLANALLDRYQVTGTTQLFDEIIKLHREALALRPAGHPNRAESCHSLADSLWQHFGKTQDVMVLDQALAFARDSAASWSPFQSWPALLLLCSIHLEQRSPHLSISTAMGYLLQAAISLPNKNTEFMHMIQNCLDQIWLIHDIWTPDIPLLLLDVYSNIIDRLSRITRFAFDTISQLTALRSARSFGSDACVVALLLGRPRRAIELIEHAHGVIWAQALHQRDPQLQDIPQSLASELETLLRAVSMPMTTHAVVTFDPAPRYLSPEDVRHQQNSRIQTILTEVRALPGLGRFMLGQTYAQLRETASEHPVVVLVSARGHVYALIIRDSTVEDPDKVHLKLTADRLSLLRDTAARTGLRQGGQGEADVQDLQMESERAIRLSRQRETTPLATLADLWHCVVRPIVSHLQLQVCIRGLHLSLFV